MTQARLTAVSIATLLSGIFLFSWWNAFIAGNGVDGVFLFAGRELLAGRIPYRDFGLVVPPFEVFKGAFAVHFFPEQSMAAARMIGLVERCVCAVFLMLWLTRVFPLASSVIATVVSMVMFTAASADPMAGYNQSASTWAVIAGYFASRALTSPRWSDLLLSGAAAACGLLVKQTTGVGLAAAIGFVLLVSLWRSKGWASGLRAVSGFAAGWILILGATSAWLASHDAFGPFLNQNFLQGATAKGPLWMSLLRPFTTTFNDPWLIQEMVAAGAILLALYFLVRNPSTLQANPSVALAAVLSIAALGAGYALTQVRPQLASYARIDVFERIGMYATLLGCLAMTVVLAPWRKDRAQLWLFAAIGIGIGYMHALSFVITNGAFVPGLAFLMALGLSRLEGARFGALLRPALLALCLLALTLSAFHKWMVPFAWIGWSDVPVHEAKPVSMPELRVLRGGDDQQEFTQRLTQLLRENSGPERESYLFFYLPHFYVLSGTRPRTYSFTPFIDVASDPVARGDAEILLQHPPPVIAYTIVGPDELSRWERDFRAGRPSGQRDLIAALDRIVENYQLLDTLHMPGTGREVRVYIQKTNNTVDGTK